MSATETTTATAVPVTAVSTKIAPSFVWVKTAPGSSTQHQAELLEIRSTGYWVRWTLCGKEELIPLTSVLEQELPRRRRLAAKRVEDGKEEMEGATASPFYGIKSQQPERAELHVAPLTKTDSVNITKKRSTSQASNKENHIKLKHAKIRYSDTDDRLPVPTITSLPPTVTPEKYNHNHNPFMVGVVGVFGWVGGWRLDARPCQAPISQTPNNNQVRPTPVAQRAP